MALKGLMVKIQFTFWEKQFFHDNKRDGIYTRKIYRQIAPSSKQALKSFEVLTINYTRLKALCALYSSFKEYVMDSLKTAFKFESKQWKLQLFERLETNCHRKKATEEQNIKVFQLNIFLTSPTLSSFLQSKQKFTLFTCITFDLSFQMESY